MRRGAGAGDQADAARAAGAVVLGGGVDLDDDGDGDCTEAARTGGPMAMRWRFCVPDEDLVCASGFRLS